MKSASIFSKKECLKSSKEISGNWRHPIIVIHAPKRHRRVLSSITVNATLFP